METETLDALKTTEQIDSAYRSYLISTFRGSHPGRAREFESTMKNAELSKGPFLEASAPFEQGCSVRELVEEGLLSDLFLRFSPQTFPIDRPLHLHQETAVRKAAGGRNLIVATGTGSGKTEAFLLPILNGLFREIESGSIARAGVRALLLYPMNALANDQVKRLRRLLEPFPEITFGRYVGETGYTKQGAEDAFRHRYPSEPLIPNELLSREELQANPPSLLLTNYAMLEYLLLRPKDSPFFDGDNAQAWRHLVLDEAHVYDGAQGTEVAMLLRRVRDRIHSSEPGRLQCFATSATMGKGQEDYPDLIEFAERMFDEPFEWVDHDLNRQDIVEATRRSLVLDDAAFKLPQEAFGLLQQAFRNGAPASELAQQILAHAPSLDSRDGEAPEAYLHRVLGQEQTVISVQEQLSGGSRSIDDLARHAFGGDRARNDVVKLVDLAVAAKPRPDDAPLLPARYHYWLKSLDGGYLCQHPEHPAGANRLQMERHKTCPWCQNLGIQSHLVEIGVCRSCGSEYAIGRIEPTGAGEQFQLHSGPKFDYLHISDVKHSDLTDEDADALGDELLDDQELPTDTTQYFDVESGLLSDSRQQQKHQVRITRIDLPDNSGQLKRCVVCSASRRDGVVSPYRTGRDAPLSVIATALYQNLPPSPDPGQMHEIGKGRKLLSFADSRQDAAFAAPFLNRTYERAVVRRVVLQAISDLSKRYGEAPRFDDVVDNARRAVEDVLLNPDDGRAANQKTVERWVTREALALDRRQSLDGLGLVDIRSALPRLLEPPDSLLRLGLERDECFDLLQILLDTLRLSGAVSTPDGVDISHEMFAPRNVQIAMREQGSASGILSWLPGARSTNRRVEILRKVLLRRTVEAGPVDVLKNVWEQITGPAGDGLFTRSNDHRGVTFALNHTRLEFGLASTDNPAYQCAKCRNIWWRTIAGECPSWRCEGTLELVDAATVDSNHYAQLYRKLDVIGMSVEEHTAQWRPDKASEIQDRFVRGKLNVLSCSTTFEMGVDVGDVQAVLLRNVPPSASNYVQRAGRAGRRQNSAAVVIAMAQLRSHDRTFFNDPMTMIDGHVNPPRIHLENTPILRRHAHSVAFAAFQRHLADRGLEPATQVGKFFRERGESGADAFQTWLNCKPTAIQTALQRVLPDAASAEMDIAGWGWVEALYQHDDSEPTFGWMKRAAEDVDEESEALSEMIADAFDQQRGSQGDRLKRVKRNLEARSLLGFLASRNILPKYGFPIDVVPLHLSDAGAESQSLELDRDLRVAITEFAPGESVVAGGQLWVAKGIRQPHRGEELPKYHWKVCHACEAFRMHIEEVSPECPECGCQKTRSQKGAGHFISPRYGFVGKHEGEPHSPPSRRTGTQTYFGSYRDAAPEFAEIPELSSTLAVSARASSAGRIVTINVNGYRFCPWCGKGERASGRSSKDHDDLRRPGKKCAGRMQFTQLGHDYLTDVLEIQFEGTPRTRFPGNSMTSLLSALLAAVPAIGINRAEVDGTMHFRGRNSSSAMVLFDTVPGGAGHAQRILDNLPALFMAARRVVVCSCQESASCYGCLRTYRNQYFHDELSRDYAQALIDHILSTRKPDEFKAFSPLVHGLLRKVSDLGASTPVAEFATSSGDVLEVAWPDQQVAILLDRDEHRDSQLFEDGWTAQHVHDWVPEKLIEALNSQK
ncbi:MAG: DEAD/DEAH box helicase [Acidimicrobiaceae bacterium]|nr:DEAD/DEAH box helicase [Acidimicrobiaceae bacterium]